MSGKNEKFTNFFTKRNPKDKEQGASYTANQHAQPNLSVSAAKLQQNSETTKEKEEILRSSFDPKRPKKKKQS